MPLLFFSLVVAAFVTQIEWRSSVGLVEKVIYLNRFFSDFLIALAVTVLFYGADKTARLFAAVFAFLFLFIYFAQYQSYSVMGTFMQSIALENADHANLMDLSNTYRDASLWITLFVVACIIIHKVAPKTVRFTSRIVFALLLVVLASLIKNDKLFISEETRSARFDFYNSGAPGFAHESPASELVDTYKKYRKHVYKQRWLAEKQSVLSASASEFAFNNYQHFGQQNAQLPMLHKGQFENPLPYEALLTDRDEQATPAQQKKNIIVFFVEGLSSRVMQPYSEQLPGLTPKINQFASNKTIRINNYYNHSYATYRGLGGQLCSIYPIGRLIDTTRYHCLPHILNSIGYQTKFLFSQQSSKTDLDEMFARAGVSDIQSASIIRTRLKNAESTPADLSQPGLSITDRELILGLIEELKTLENTEAAFFAGLYNIETHANARLFKAKTVYQNKVGENSYVLDNFHNFDKTFGLFWEYFKHSPHAKNTIVVLTSDHATAPSRDYLKLDLGAPKMFIDQIPFLIYHPDLASNYSFDAKHRTSIDFAPTILNILGVKNQLAHFVGHSLFSQSANLPPAAAWSDSAMWQLDQKTMEWLEIDADTSRRSERISIAVDQFEYLEYLSELEQQNKLWKN